MIAIAAHPTNQFETNTIMRSKVGMMMANGGWIRKKAHAVSACIALIAILAAGGASAETTKERILREGRIVIGIHNRAPWGYRDASSGEPSGWHPDLIKAAFSELGVEDIELRITEFGALIPGLLAKRFDAVASGLAITPDRCGQIAFSEPDLQVPDAALVLVGNPKNIGSYADIAANPEIILGVGRGSASAENATAAGVPEDRILLFPDIPANISALRAGRIDVAVFSSPTVISIMSGSNSEGLERALPFEAAAGDANYAAIGFRKGDEDLVDLYNSRLAELKAGATVARIMEKYGFGQPEIVPDDVTTKQLCRREP